MSCSNQQQERKKAKYFKCLSGVWIKSLIFMSFLRGLGRFACLHPSFPAGKQIQSDCKHDEGKHSPRITGKRLTNSTWHQQSTQGSLYPLQGQDGNRISQEFQGTAMFSGKILGGL